MDRQLLIAQLRDKLGLEPSAGPSLIERPAWPPHRNLPPLEDRGPELARFRVWVMAHEKLKVTIVSNLVLSVGEALRMSSVEQIYRSLEPAAFASFQRAQASIPYVLPRSLELACCVVGTIKTYVVPGEGTVDIGVEDLMLHSFAYREQRRLLLEERPDWIPFFFRGGVPPGMAAVGDAFFAVHQAGAQQRPALRDYTWLPGLSHDVARVGTPPVQLFTDDLERRLRLHTGETFHLWVVDTSFTGSTALTSLVGALGRARVPPGKRLQVTVALFVPLRENLPWSARQEEPTVLDTTIRGVNGERVLLRRVARPANVASMAVRVFPLRRSLTEDDERMLELTYLLPPRKRRPVYGIGRRERVLLTVSSAAGPAVSLMVRADDRGDTLHDWFFNAFNPRRLRQFLIALKLPVNFAEAEAGVLAMPELAPFRAQGVLFHL